VKGRSTEFGAASRLCHASGWRQAVGQGGLSAGRATPTRVRRRICWGRRRVS